jgi:ribosomal protein S3AE
MTTEEHILPAKGQKLAPDGVFRPLEEVEKMKTDLQTPPPSFIPAKELRRRTAEKKEQLATQQLATQDVKESETEKLSKVILTWHDKNGKSRSTEYICYNLTVDESAQVEIRGATRKDRISLSVSADVVRKNA